MNDSDLKTIDRDKLDVGFPEADSYKYLYIRKDFPNEGVVFLWNDEGDWHEMGYVGIQDESSIPYLKLLTSKYDATIIEDFDDLYLLTGSCYDKDF